MIALNETHIRSYIHNNTLNKLLHFHVLDTIDSTNLFLRNQPHIEGINICCAEMQTDGRGRFGRHWHSPRGENIYFSARLSFNCDLSLLSGLSLVVSLAVIQVFKELGITNHLLIKWPNDILWHEQKISGCLIELISESYSQTEVIIGIGININSNTQMHPLPDKPWCSLFDITGEFHDRNDIIGRLIEHLYLYLNQLTTAGFVHFLAQWHEFDKLYEQQINVQTPMGSLSGQAKGVDDTGRLILIDNQEKTHYLSSGETSITIQDLL